MKMSQFHWHVVDSPSFPLYIAEYPELSKKGAYSSKETYSSQDVQDIVQYAGAVSFIVSPFPMTIVSKIILEGD